MLNSNIKYLISILLLIITMWQAISIHSLSKEKQTYKIDYAELNSVQYGLMSVQTWKQKISWIFKKKIDEFELTNTNQAEVQQKIEEMLYWVLSEVDKVMQERANEGNIFQKAGAWFVRNFALDLNDLRQRVPDFSSRAIQQLGNQATMQDIKRFINEKFDEYLEMTIQEEDRSKLTELQLKYGASNIETCSSIISSKEQKAAIAIWNKSIAIILCALLIFVLWFIASDKYQSPLHFYLLTAVCFVLLFVGITTPMIDIDARIKSLSLEIAGEPVLFEDQILFFQSKSILEVVNVMLQEGQLETVLVGLLIFLFSVVFPFGKLMASLLIIRRPTLLKSNSMLRFLALKSGKWSMADVTVVAIFMSYIGFQGIITNQLYQLETITNTIDVITTNNTSLQVGFIVFTFFCICSLLLSSTIETYVKNNLNHYNL